MQLSTGVTVGVRTAVLSLTEINTFNAAAGDVVERSCPVDALHQNFPHNSLGFNSLKRLEVHLHRDAQLVTGSSLLATSAISHVSHGIDASYIIHASYVIHALQVFYAFRTELRKGVRQHQFVIFDLH